MISWQGCLTAITGATGFVGHHTALALRRHGADVIALARPTSNTRRLEAAGVACKVASLDDAEDLARALGGCEVVIHVAGAVGFGNDWAMFRRVNVQGTLNLLDAARRAGVRRVVHTSSICAVGSARTPRVLDETAVWNLGRYRVPYITSKRMAEEAALTANGREMEVVVVNPGSVVGPDDFAASEFGTLCRRFWKGRIPFHFGGGNNFVDVRDVAAGIRLAAERGRPGERYLLTGENRTYQAFFWELCRAADRSIARVRLPDPCARLIGHVNDWFDRRHAKRMYLSAAQAELMGLYLYFDASKARRELGFETRPLRQSLADAHAFWMTPGHRSAAA